MSRFALPLAAVMLAMTFSSGPVLAQPTEPAPAPSAPEVEATAPPEPPPELAPPTVQTVRVDPVGVAALTAPDAFTTPGRETGLPASLWRDTPIATMRAVLPLIATRPLSPAAAALARRVLATGAQGPQPVDNDASGDLAGARVSALVALGDLTAARAILERAPGLDRSSGLSRAAAESALLAGDDLRACAIADALSTGRDDIYWLRLRAWCQVTAGQTGAAQLTFDLAQTHARDAVYGRLMSAKLAGAAPGAASLRNGLDYAMSRSLGLDLSKAKPSPAVAAATDGGEVTEPAPSVIAADLVSFAEALSGGSPGNARVSVDGTKPRTAAAGLLAFAFQFGRPVADFGDFPVSEGKAPLGRNLALQAAADAKQLGFAALLALLTSTEAGAAGPAIGDRVRIVMALKAVGLETDARNFALEGLAALK